VIRHLRYWDHAHNQLGRYRDVHMGAAHEVIAWIVCIGLFLELSQPDPYRLAFALQR
jgi:hypothetical protein